MNGRTIAFAIGLTCKTGGALVGQQSGTVTHRGPAADSAFVRYAGDALFSNVAAMVAHAAHDTATRAWTFSFPKPDTAQAWRELRAHLKLSLRGRDPAPGDSVRSYTKVDEPVIQGDTMTFRVTIGFADYCDHGFGKKGWLDNAQYYAVKSVLSNGTWMAPTVTWAGEAFSPICRWGAR